MTNSRTGSLFDQIPPQSDSEILAQSGTAIKVELIKQLHEIDSQSLITMSHSTVSEFGNPFIFEPASMRKYFNYPRSFPFILRVQNDPVACIIGIPLEQFNKESWVKCDANWGAGNTVYTTAFIVHPQHRKPHIIQPLATMYLNWISRKGFQYITGHKRENVELLFNRPAESIKRFDNWQNGKNIFEYFRINV